MVELIIQDLIFLWLPRRDSSRRKGSSLFKLPVVPALPFLQVGSILDGWISTKPEDCMRLEN
jgi:hypothetical protein